MLDQWSTEGAGVATQKHFKEILTVQEMEKI